MRLNDFLGLLRALGLLGNAVGAMFEGLLGYYVWGATKIIARGFVLFGVFVLGIDAVDWIAQIFGTADSQTVVLLQTYKHDAGAVLVAIVFVYEVLALLRPSSPERMAYEKRLRGGPKRVTKQNNNKRTKKQTRGWVSIPSQREGTFLSSLKAQLSQKAIISV
jgi:hypothetical protein